MGDGRKLSGTSNYNTNVEPLTQERSTRAVVVEVSRGGIQSLVLDCPRIVVFRKLIFQRFRNRQNFSLIIFSEAFLAIVHVSRAT
jgi:hypothetical protein